MADLFDEHEVMSTAPALPALLTAPSLQSLYIVMSVNYSATLEGTAFVVRAREGAFLITNWHLLTGRDPYSEDFLDGVTASPDSIRIYQNAATGLGNWIECELPLLDPDGKPLWLEHPVHGRDVDVVALPLTNDDQVALYPFGIRGITGHDATELPTLPRINAGDVLQVPGFPEGRTLAGKLAIWSRGSLATDLVVDVDDLPMFMIDARTRKGQSGSPVIYQHNGGWLTLDNGRPFLIHNSFTWLLGVYSGRAWPDSDLGRVWKRSVISEIIDGTMVGADGSTPDAPELAG